MSMQEGFGGGRGSFGRVERSVDRHCSQRFRERKCQAKRVATKLAEALRLEGRGEGEDREGRLADERERTGLEALWLTRTGACSESLWPWLLALAFINSKPGTTLRPGGGGENARADSPVRCMWVFRNGGISAG